MRNKFVYLGLPLILILAIGGGYLAWQSYDASAESSDDLVAHELEELPSPSAGSETDVGDLSGAQDVSVSEAQAEPEVVATVKPSDIKVVVEGSDPTQPRSVGRADAPVTITEFASLTCPHCAHAHETVLPQIIKDYVETGKVRIIFSDFPLNQQALDATKVSRCVAADQYFTFVSWLFSHIQQWAYSDTHPATLLQNAALTGLSADHAKACMADTTVEAAVIASMRDAGQKYGIDSTPTFVFNDGKKTISGARPYAEFKAAIDELLKPAN